MRLALVCLAVLTACDDTGSGGSPSTGRDGGDGSGGDAAPGDGGGPNDAIVFDNRGGTFVWQTWCHCLENEPGNYLDLTRAADAQSAEAGPSSIDFFKQDSSIGNITPGGFWFRSRGARFAAGERFVIPGDYRDGSTDIHVIPPRALATGDVVGPDDNWVDSDPYPEAIDPDGVQTAHFSDLTGETGPDQIWFMAGTIGVQFHADDGVHYGFIELEWEPGQNGEWASLHVPVRWGYHPIPDQPLVIPR